MSQHYGPPSGRDDRYSDRSTYRGGGGPSNSRYGSSYGGGSNDAMGKIGANLKTITWDISKLPVFEKNFYLEHPEVSSRSEPFSEQWRKSKNISVVGRGIPKVSYIICSYFAMFSSLPIACINL